MRTTLALDDELFAKAHALTGPSEKSSMLREVLRALVQRESAKGQALPGGSGPHRLVLGEREKDLVSALRGGFASEAAVRREECGQAGNSRWAVPRWGSRLCLPPDFPPADAGARRRAGQVQWKQRRPRKP
jgi:Arc/MetJ family transcription regulator